MSATRTTDEQLRAEAEALTDAYFEELDADLNTALRNAVTKAVERDDWPGDVDPPTVMRLKDALRATLRQLIENGLYMHRSLSMDQAEQVSRRIMDHAMHGPFLAGIYDEDFVAFRGTMGPDGVLRLETMNEEGTESMRLGRDGRPT